MSTVSENAKKYELMIIVDPDIGEKAIKEHFDRLRKSIGTLNGEVFYEDEWGLRDLAYQIKKRDRGHYMILDFMVEPEHILEFDRKLRLDLEVLRHMITVLPVHYKPESYANIEEIEEEKLPAKEQFSHSRNIKESTERKKVSVPKVKEDVAAIPIPSEEKVKTALDTNEIVEEKEPKKVSSTKTASSEEDLKSIDAKLDKILSNPDLDL